MLGCLALLPGDLVMLTLAGQAFIDILVVTVGLPAELQWVGLRKAVAQPGW